MSTINEETQIEDAALAAGGGVAHGGDATVTEQTGAPTSPITDGADDGELERELEGMENAASALQREGMISESDAQEKRKVAHTRKLFRDLPPAERAAIIRRRREIGRQLLERQLSGAAMASVRLNHTRLKPLFEQWWPYLNGMSINMKLFGRSTSSAQDQGAVSDWFEKQVGELEAYVNEQLEVAPRGYASAAKKR